MDEDSFQDRQESEKAALKAIYGDQMKVLNSNEKLWIPLECVLRLWPPSSQGPHRSDGPVVDLHIICPYKYPDESPVIMLRHAKKISLVEIDKLTYELNKIADACRGEVMIFELAQHIEERLCNYNKPHYESCYEEMVSRNEEIKENELLKRQADEEKMKEDMILKIERVRQDVKKALRKKSSPTSIPINLDQNKNLPRQVQPDRKLTNMSEDVPTNITSVNPSGEDFMPWNIPNSGHSRFKSEFEHIKWIGQGAFGNVLKVRNKLDDGFYAIKRIELNPNKKQLNKKITREVKLLSRLNHENVVRYYNSWIEMALPEDKKSDDNASDNKKLSITTEDVVSFQNKRGWTLDKDSESTSDSSDHTWIAFGSASKISLKQTETTNSNSDSNTSNKTQPKTMLYVMYIQMELCEKSTLRIAIDNGLYKETDRAWQLFREIVEGLCHIHQQGIIHRDLKPVNIFIGQDDHVKIGDFGLATTITLKILQKLSVVGVVEHSDKSNSAVTISSQQGKDISHTGQVGTAFYVAPELNESGYKVEYNQKVDIYSLGIIFFEMCHPPFATAMERSKVLNDLRLPNPVFPKDFHHNKSSNQYKLIKWMLNHDVKQRPSSLNVLQSEMVPPSQYEKADVKDMVRRTLSNPQSKDYKYLVASCFNQELSPTLDATFNVSSWRSNWFISLVESVSEILRRIMRAHGAISFLPPLLTPAKEIPDSSVSLMTRLGSIVVATFDTRTPFVRFLTHNPGVCHMKRYAIDKTYKERPAGVHPKEGYECAFDIVTSTPGDMMPEIELLQITWEILCEFPNILKKNATIRINHSSLLKAVLISSGLDHEKCDSVCAILAKSKQSEFDSRIDIESKLRSCGVADHIITSIMGYVLLEGTYRKVASYLESLSSNYSTIYQALKQLETLIGYCNTLGISCPVIVSLRLLQYAHNYSGVMFQVTYDQLSKQKQIEHILLFGGRYDKLLRESKKYILPIEDGKNDEQYVAGFILSIDKLVTSFGDSDKPGIADILICSMGQLIMTPDRLHLVRDLWKSGLKTYFINSMQRLEDIQSYSQDMGVQFIIILKETEPGYARVRSFTSDRFSDKKVSYKEIIDYIRRTKSKGITEIHCSTPLIKDKYSPLMNFIVNEKLTPFAKRRYENQILNVISPVVQRLSSTVKIEIIVVTLDSEALTLLSSCLNLNAAEQDINSFLKKYPRQKKYVQKIVNQFDDGKRSLNPPVLILYSIADNVYKVLI